jgi:ribosomal protein L16 Arg81 hydroxylase
MVYNDDNWNYFYHTRRFSSYVHKNPCSNQYPNYYKARRFEVILNEGDTLYIPSGWFHHIYSEEVSSNINMSINFWTNTDKKEINIFNQSYSHINTIPVLDSSKSIDYETNVKLSQPFTFYTAFEKPTVQQLYELFNNLLLNNCKQSYNTFISHLVDLNSEHKYTYITFDEFIKQTDNYNYVLGNNISQHLNNNKWIQSLIPSFLKNKDIFTHVWLNHGNVSTRNHYDIYENILFQVYGSKIVLLCPPDERANLYMINPYPLKFILQLNNNLYNKSLILENKSIVNKESPFIQFYTNCLKSEVCKQIINIFNDNNAKCGFLTHIEIDKYLFEKLNVNLSKYLDVLKILNIELDFQNINDTGYYVENILYSNNSNTPKGAVLKYIMFLNDAESTYINDVEIPGSEGSLLIYPVHFSYRETNELISKDKWICSGYICG